MMLDMVRINWCRDASEAKALAFLFSSNLTTSYISHSELQGPRAIEPGRWVPNIAEVIQQDLLGRVDSVDDPAPGQNSQLAAGIHDSAGNAGVMLVTFSRAAPVPYGVLEDIVLRSDLRGKGYGRQALDWLDAECRRRGITRLFLESGIGNHRAHELFERDGFKPISVVMMKSIDP